MPYSKLETKTANEMVDVLNGVIRTEPLQIRQPYESETDPGGEEVFDGLNGLTLVFTTPAVTVTFNANPDPITVSEMLTELNTDVQAVESTFLAKIRNADQYPQSVPPTKILTMETDTAAGIVINLAASTAASRLGLPTSGTLTKARIDSTKVLTAGDTISGGMYIILSP